MMEWQTSNQMVKYMYFQYFFLNVAVVHCRPIDIIIYLYKS